ncbi:MAG: hypothetical protein ABJA34_08065 [Pseudonocardiales bacterium]
MAAALILTTGTGTAQAGGADPNNDNGPTDKSFNVHKPGSGTPGTPGGSSSVAYDPNAQICVYVTPPANQDPVYNTAKPPTGAKPGGQNMNELCGRAADVNAALGTSDPSTMCRCTMIYGVWVNNPPPSPAQIARDLFASLKLSKPNIHTSPDASHHLIVSLPTWLWIDGATSDQHASRDGISITAKQTVDWSVDGSAVPCQGAGTPYQPGVSDPSAASPTCGYRFPGAGNHTITAQVTWTGSYTVGGGPPTTIDTPIAWTVSKPVVLDEVQTVNG